MNFVSDAYVKPLAASVPLSVATGEPLECEPLDDASVLDKDFSSVPLARRRLTKDVGAGRKLSAQRPCLFVGGNGLDSDQTPTSSSGTYDYWGPAITQSCVARHRLLRTAPAAHLQWRARFPQAWFRVHLVHVPAAQLQVQGLGRPWHDAAHL